MSTPSPQPLDYDPISPYAPKHARDHDATLSPSIDTESATPPKQRPAAIENDHDAQIFDEIENSLRVMIAAQHGAENELRAESEVGHARKDAQDGNESGAMADETFLPSIDRLDAPALADQDQAQQEHRYYEAMRVQQVMQQVVQQLAQRNARDLPPVQAEEPPAPPPPASEPRLPPAFLARPMEPIQYDEPWPKARAKKRRTSATTLFVRFGFAAGGAAAVMMFALPDMRARLLGSFAPIAAISTNAAAVFGEGKPQTPRNEAILPVPVRTQPVIFAQESDRPAAPMPKLATANLGPTSDLRSVSRPETPPAEPAPVRETVMIPAAPQAPAAAEPVTRAQTNWPAPSARPENESRTSGVASRPLSAEEIDLLRKMAGDFMAAGDFAGARGVLERAAEAGDASSAFALAATYDSAALARFKVKGLGSDTAKAAYWYERARDLGSPEAPQRLRALARSN